MFLVLLLADFLAITLTSERFFDALFFARLQIKGVALDLLDDVFRLHFTLKTTESIFKGLAFLNSNLCQERYTSKQSQQGTSTEYSNFRGFVDVTNESLGTSFDVALRLLGGVGATLKIIVMFCKLINQNNL